MEANLTFEKLTTQNLTPLNAIFLAERPEGRIYYIEGDGLYVESESDSATQLQLELIKPVSDFNTFRSYYPGLNQGELLNQSREVNGYTLYYV